MPETGGWTARFDDPGAYAAAIQNTASRVLPSQGGRFTVQVTLARLPGIHLTEIVESGPRLHEATLSPQRLFFRIAPPAAAPSAMNGEIDPPGTLRVGTGGFPFADRSFGPITRQISSIGHADLAARMAALGVTTGPGLLGQGERFQPPPERLAALAWLRDAALRLARENPGVLAHPMAAAMLDAQLGEAHVAALAGGITGLDRAAQRRGHAIMRRIEAHLEAHLTEPLSLSALCAAGHCSAKTLEVLFKERLGMTPNRYLRARRLALARQRLRAGTGRSVSEIALDCGFWELGRFALAYRATYGERPSETLRRAAADYFTNYA